MPVRFRLARRIPGPRAVLLALVWATFPAPADLRAQAEEETSLWQFALREADWGAVERLQDEVRNYREAGAIGAYELLIRADGGRLDAAVAAEIVDAGKLAELRGLAGARLAGRGGIEPPETRPRRPSRDPGPAEQPAGAPLRLDRRFPLDAPPDDL